MKKTLTFFIITLCLSCFLLSGCKTNKNNFEEFTLNKISIIIDSQYDVEIQSGEIYLTNTNINNHITHIFPYKEIKNNNSKQPNIIFYNPNGIISEINTGEIKLQLDLYLKYNDIIIDFGTNKNLYVKKINNEIKLFEDQNCTKEYVKNIEYNNNTTEQDTQIKAKLSYKFKLEGN